MAKTLLPIYILLLNLPHIIYNFSNIPNLKLNCELGNNSFALYAYDRAKTQQCKEKIINDACFFQTIKSLDYTLAYKQLERKCPITMDHSLHRYCVSKENFKLLISKSPNKQLNATNEIYIHNENLCKKYCLTYFGHKYAAFLRTRESTKSTCTCFKSLNQYLLAELEISLFDCESNNADNVFIFETGLFDLSKVNYEISERFRERNKEKCLEEPSIFSSFFTNNDNCNERKKLNRIVFVFTVSLRTDRQILRLIKTLYSPIHYYYIHVDEGSVYLRKKLEIEIEKLHTRKNITNIVLSKWSMRAIWGGASLLKVHLRIMNDLIELKANNTWSWDYFINLSESDYPVKTVEEFDNFMSQFVDGENLIGFSSPYHSIENLLRNQGTHYHFIECEHRMWMIADRRLPIGVQFELANDWVLLHYTFVEYILKSNDEFLVYLKSLFNDTLMSAEIFYHTIIVNSPFCNTVLDIHLRDMNFKRKSGRSCQCDRTVIDWCGCSPNYYNSYDFERLKKLRNSSVFLARKFDPIRNQEIINSVDQTLSRNDKYGDIQSLKSYWLNYYSNLEETNDNFETFSNIDFKFKFMLSVFYEFSVKKMFDLLSNKADNDSNLIRDQFLNESIKLALDQKRPTMLQDVFSYFHEDDFKGFVLSFKSNNEKNITFETFFKQNNDFIIETTNERYDWHNYDKCYALSEHQVFYNLIDTIEVSTDFENREMRCGNYAGIIDENSHPVLIINFMRNFNRNFTFYTQWFNPDGQLVDENIWHLKSGYYAYGQYIYVFLKREMNRPINTGIWSLKISFNSYYDRRKKFKFYNYKEDADVLIKYKFNVLPSKNSIANVDTDGLFKIWSFNALCVAHSSVLLNSVEICSQNAEWSSFYPDSKSDLFNHFNT